MKRVCLYWLLLTWHWSCTGPEIEQVVPSESNTKAEHVIHPLDSAATEVHQANSSLNIEFLQGIWTSYSHYLEHESEFKDFHKNKYFRIISGHKYLDIILYNHDIDSITTEEGYIGFTNINQFDSTNYEVNQLENSGNILVKLNSNPSLHQSDKVKFSYSFNCGFDVEKIFEDNIEMADNEKVSYVNIQSIPPSIFRAIKQNNENHIEKFGIKKYSRLLEIVSQKSHFYSTKSEDGILKSYLIHGDIAYIEDYEGGDWVKAYYNGSTITTGYLMKSDVKILEHPSNQ